MNADEKIRNLEAQIAACGRGATNLITCPYCSTQMHEGDPLCCPPAAAAVAAILHRADTNAQIDLADQIGERALRN